MGLTPSELENVTPYQFNLLREGYQQNQKHEWQRTRFIAYWVYTMAGKVGNDLTIEEFRPLDEDDLKKEPAALASMPKYTKKQEEYLHTLFNPGK